MWIMLFRLLSLVEQYYEDITISQKIHQKFRSKASFEDGIYTET